MEFPDRLAILRDGTWRPTSGTTTIPVENPASGDVLSHVVPATREDVDATVVAAHAAHLAWRETPVTERVQALYRFKALLERHLDELATIITLENGKTLDEARAEIVRGMENVEVACGAPMLMQGYNNEDIARGIDEHLFRRPLGVVTAITPFNFPAMIPLWFLPYAIATGNAFILKPSEKVPLTAHRLFELLMASDLPDGVVSLLQGDKGTVDALLDHPQIRAVSFVGSTAVARYVYQRASANGKRAQCQGGAKNPAVVLPDADLDVAARILADSAFGCAGQRCLATSVVVGVGSATADMTSRLRTMAERRVVGSGLSDDVEMGPVIDAASRSRILDLLASGRAEGAEVVTGGQARLGASGETGHFVDATILRNVARDGTLARTEIFGPVVTVMHADDLDAAIDVVNDRAFGNQASIFTSNGSAARQFRYEARAGNIGVNLGVAAPMAFFPFSGWNDSFFGALHAQGRHGIEFYTETQVVIERWPSDWSRRF